MTKLHITHAGSGGNARFFVRFTVNEKSVIPDINDVKIRGHKHDGTWVDLSADIWADVDGVAMPGVVVTSLYGVGFTPSAFDGIELTYNGVTATKVVT